ESQPSKLLVAGSIPVSRSSLCSPRSRASYGWHASVKAGTATAVPGIAADSSAVARSAKADVAQLAERVLGKDEVTSSILVIGSNLRAPARRARYGWRASR